MPANDDIIISDQPGKSANREDNPKRGILRREERRANDVSFAGAPISVEQGGSTSPTDVARAMMTGGVHSANSLPVVTSKRRKVLMGEDFQVVR